MSYIDEWGKNKPKYLTVFFHQCISSVDAVCEFFDSLKNDPTLEKNFSIADADEWNSYYHGNFVASDFIFMLLSEFSPLGQLKGAKYENIFNDIFKMLPTDKTQLTKKLSDEITKKAEPLIEEIARLSSIDIQSEINGEVDEGLVEKFREEVLSTSEGAFFYLVWAPCILTYLQSPKMLYDLAATGDLEALQKLVSLDSSVIADKTISEQIHNLRVNGKRSDYEETMLFLSNPPDVPTSSLTIKYMVAAFLYESSKLMGKKVSQNQIKKLFDAWVQDNSGELIDQDFSENESSFDRSVYDYRSKLWPFTKPEDK